MEETYSLWTGLIYVFNLIVGTGALTLPAAVLKAGWIVGIAMLCFLAIVSYITLTFVVEAMATANAITQWYKMKRLKRINQGIGDDDDDHDNVDDDDDDVERINDDNDENDSMLSSEDAPLYSAGTLRNFPPMPVTFFSIDEKVEMGQMARLFFPKVGQFLFYLTFCLYLFGDLSIYSAAISKSLVDVVCEADRNSSLLKDNEPCFENYNITQKTAYRLFLSAFLVVFGPFVFFNVQKTKYLQILTSLTRWLAFTSMIALAIRRLLSPSLPHGDPTPAHLHGVPTLFGACIYSFMCHHSLPGLLAPIHATSKRRLLPGLAADYLLILLFYLTLVLTGIFAFPDLQPLYTLNFTPRPGDSGYLRAVDYFLALFPVFTLSTSFPVIAVTLRSNLQALLSPSTPYCIRQIIVPAFGVIAPVLLAVVVDDVNTLVGFTGSYAGTGIQYLIPAFLLISAKSAVPPELARYRNPFASPFRSTTWLVLVICWSIVCITFVSINLIKY
ncbi:transmembrane protein 104 homolog isoform X2 [Nilaparvata lugens]|uniref:transmembrane protein 104 homolog isoform X2 n=1 Tax=Nilaparvata lugens TaxID=108931 RepID=UPI00193E3200|nr:transmembrane protein 104 homolog isoform X2 [Nilaparvata lugens]